MALDIKIHEARIEDILRLAVKGDKAPLTGRMEMTTTFLLPAGEADVIDRLNLDGQFRLAQARFSNINIQRRIEALSQRARGNEDAQPGDDGSSVVSNLRGRFVMRGAKLDFSQLTFTIPGAEVQLAGIYDLHGESLDFKGDTTPRRQPRRHDERLQGASGPPRAAVLPSSRRWIETADQNLWTAIETGVRAGCESRLSETTTRKSKGKRQRKRVDQPLPLPLAP